MLISTNGWLDRTELRARIVAGLFAGALGISSLQAGLDTYSVFKGEHYTQPSATAPGQAEEFGVWAFATMAEGFTPVFANAQPVAAIPIPVYLEQIEGRPENEYSGRQTHASAMTRDEYFPDGQVTFTLFDFDTNPEATLTLTTPTLPPIPAIANYTEAQSIDPSQPFTLRWNSFAGAGAQDTVWVQIQSWEGPLLITAIPGAPGALAGSSTEVVIPAGTLTGQEGILASIGFFKVAEQTAGSLPDSTAMMGSYRITMTELNLQGSGGGGDGPTLVATTPASGTFNVSTDTEVRFDFSEPMAPIEDITWTAQGIALDSGLFTYTWINDGTTLVASYITSFPADTIISWTLGEGFQNESGVPLEGDLLYGLFVTGSGSGGGDGDCEGSEPFDEPGSFSVTRALRFLQSGPGTVLPHPEGGAFVVASFDPPPTLSVSGASLIPPSGESIPLQSFFGSAYFYFDSFPDAAVLNEAFAPGNYAARVEPEAGSAIQLSVNASGNFPPTPELLNHEAAQAIDPETPFTLQWNTFVGANASSFIGLDVMEQEADTVFFAPNECEDIELAPTATSIVIPAGTLRPGRVYDLMLNFYRLADSSEHSGSGISLFAAYGVSTTTTIRTLGGSGGSGLSLGSFTVADHGRFQATVTGDPGVLIIVEASANLIDWETVTSLSIPAAGTVSFEDPNPLNSGGGRFYRLRTF